MGMGGLMRIFMTCVLLLAASIILGCDKEIKEAVKSAPTQTLNT